MSSIRVVVLTAAATALLCMAELDVRADESADEEKCGTASNCGGLGGWRVILLATDRVEADGEAEDVDDPVEPGEPISNSAPVSGDSITRLELEAGTMSATVAPVPYSTHPDG